MAVGAIGKRSVDALKPGERDEYLWDDDLHGFGVKVTPSGRKVYLVQYRVGGRKGRTRRVTIGAHGPALPPEKARRKAKTLLGQVADRKDPAAERETERNALTMAEAIEKFLAEHVASKCKRSTAEDYERLLRQHVAPTLGRRSLADVSRADVAKLHQLMIGKPYRANAMVRVLSALFNWAEIRTLRPLNSNPCLRFAKYREHARRRFLSEAELAALGAALVAAEKAKTATPWMVGAVRLLLFTGARLREILHARWDRLDEARSMLHLADSKTGPKTLYLNQPALEVLSALPRLKDNPHIICGEKEGACLVNLEKPWRRLRDAATVHLWAQHENERLRKIVAELREAAPKKEPTLAECEAAAREKLGADFELPVGLTDARLHDLRHTVGAFAALGGVPLHTIGGILGHTQAATTKRYAHLSANPLKMASETVAGHIAAAMAPKADNVVQFPKAETA